ncbi:type IV secretion system protein VirB7 [Helicobacter vulpis]|nr:type IV secretion system protein VirB7 [Helicobacter vulpis]
MKNRHLLAVILALSLGACTGRYYEMQKSPCAQVPPAKTHRTLLS